MHYAQAHAPKAPDGSALPDPNAPYSQLGEHVPGHPYVHDPAQANDFRARFHRPLVAPSPFRAPIAAEQPPQPSGANGAGGQGDGLEAHLQSAVGLDPHLGQAREEAAGVADKLEGR